MHEIFLSKFATDVTVEAIASFIAEKTSLAKQDQFTVEKISYSSFAAFKVTVLSQKVCDLILDTKIWEPKFNACIYDHTKVKKTSEVKKNGTSAAAKETVKQTSATRRPKESVSSTGSNSTHVAKSNQSKQQAKNENGPSMRRPPAIPRSHFNVVQTPATNQRAAMMPVVLQQLPQFQASVPQYQNQNFWHNHNGLHQPQYRQAFQSPQMYSNQLNQSPMGSVYMYPTI